MPVTRDKVLSLMKEGAYHPLLIKELMHALGVTSAERHDLKRILRELIVDGEIIKIRGNRYGLPEKMSLIVGKVSAHPDGYGFVVSEKQNEPDLFIGRRNLKGAMHSDRVVARIEGSTAPGKNEGTVIRILERGINRVVGKLQAGRGFAVVIPTNPRLPREFYVGPKDMGGANPGDIVVADIVRYPEQYRSPEVKITTVLGGPGTPGLDTDMVIEEHGLATKFSKAAVEAAKSAPVTVTAAMRRGRKDLRGLLTMTIDGENARDFDDAVSVETMPGGLVKLYVSIADVAHYVKPGSPLDIDAYARATSVYFPDRVLPMLPEELSNGICSLNPNLERLTLTAEMVFNDKGERVAYEVYESVIKSDNRMTYTDVAAIIEKDDEATKGRFPHLLDTLAVMREVMDRLGKMRVRRGSIDFDLPEPEIILDLTGQMTGVARSERNLAHRLIEEFMLAANETVAFHLESHGVPFLYRIHEEPDEDRMEELGELVKEFGGTWPSVDKIRPKHLAQVLNSLVGRPEERFINTVMLRSMKQARYSPENAGHFGLASRCYCHFTSPIRRYPDLTVHRAVKELVSKGELSAERKSEMGGGLPAMGQHTSFMEREAEAAERDVVELKKLQFMTDKVGAEFEGFINGVTAFGFFVELDEYFVEGLVRLTSMHDDYYSYEQKRHALTGRHTGRTFRLGDRVKVSVERVDMELRHLDFALVGAEPAARTPRASLWDEYMKAKTGRTAPASKPGGKPGGGGGKAGGKGKAGKAGGRGGRKGR